MEIDQEERNKVEAVLFAVGKEIKTEEISGLVSLNENKVINILEQLKEEYEQKDNSLNIVKKGPYWKFTINDKYLPLVSEIVEETELDTSTMETLAVIAWKYPILQSDVVKIRNNKAYGHMKLLEEQGFIKRIKHGRTYKIKLTEKFFEYFDLPSDKARYAFKEVFPEEMQEKIESEWEEIEKKEEEIEEMKEEKKRREEEEKKKKREEGAEEQEKNDEEKGKGINKTDLKKEVYEEDEE